MGALAFSQLGEVSSESVDDAVPVGAMAMRSTTTAMVCGIDGSKPTYLAEVPLWVAMAWRAIDDADGRCHRWWRLEAKVAGSNKAVRAQHELVVAEHPYANGWVHVTPFKPASKSSASDRLQLVRGPFADVASASAAVEAQSHELWETGNYLTAALSRPENPFSNLDDVRSVQKNGLFVFGVCENFAALEKELLGQGSIGQLILSTERGTIKFWSPDAKLSAVPQLRDEVKDDRWSLMCLSIRQALAGPHKDADAWTGRPIAEKVDQIYRGHLNRRNRVVADAERYSATLESRHGVETKPTGSPAA